MVVPLLRLFLCVACARATTVGPLGAPTAPRTSSAAAVRAASPALVNGPLLFCTVSHSPAPPLVSAHLPIRFFPVPHVLPGDT